MKALVIIAHGSRREEANAEFVALVEKVRAASASKFDLVEPCFLEIASPSLTQAVEDVIGQGATAVFVFPYFLNSGNHIRRDIPNMVNRLTTQHPACTIQILPYLGAFEGMAELISRHIHDET